MLTSAQGELHPSERRSGVHPLARRANMDGAAVPDIVPALAWRAEGAVALRRTHQLCPNCKIAYVLPAESAPTEATCPQCAAPASQILAVAAQGERQYVEALASDRAYGRTLVSLQGRSQASGPGAGVDFDDPFYTACMVDATRAHFDPGGRLEPLPRAGVASFDSYLAVVSGGRFRIGSRDEARAFHQLVQREGLLIEFVNALGRTIEVVAEEGPSIVQAFPKGGWFCRTESYMDEYDLRIMRAVAGYASPTDWLSEDRSFNGLRQAIVVGRVSETFYDALHSVTAATFARMAAEACGPNGRARTAPLRPNDWTTYAVNQVRVPRHVVADCAAHAVCNMTTWRLANLEHARIAAKQTTEHILMYVTREVDATSMVLLHRDSIGYELVTVNALERGSAGRADVGAFDSHRSVHVFGLPRRTISDHADVPAQFLVPRTCTSGPCAHLPDRLRERKSAERKSGEQSTANRPMTWSDADADLPTVAPPSKERSSWAAGCTTWRTAQIAWVDVHFQERRAALLAVGSDAQRYNRLRRAFEERLVRTAKARFARAPSGVRYAAPPDVPRFSTMSEYSRACDEWARGLGVDATYLQVGGDARYERLRYLGIAWAKWYVAGDAAAPISLPVARRSKQGSARSKRARPTVSDASDADGSGDSDADSSADVRYRSIGGCHDAGDRPSQRLRSRDAVGVVNQHFATTFAGAEESGSESESEAAAAAATFGSPMQASTPTDRSTPASCTLQEVSVEERTIAVRPRCASRRGAASAAGRLEESLAVAQSPCSTGVEVSPPLASAAAATSSPAGRVDETATTSASAVEARSGDDTEVDSDVEEHEAARRLVALPCALGGAVAAPVVSDKAASAHRRAKAGLQSKPSTAWVFGETAAEVPYGQEQVSGMLNDIDLHLVASCGAFAQLSKSQAVQDARSKVRKRSRADHIWRAESLDQPLMYEGWLCFNPAYAADSAMMGETAFGEGLGPRSSCLFASQRGHLKRSGTSAGMKWERWGGKANQDLRKRERSLEHPVGCPCAQSFTGVEWTEASAVTWDEDAESVLPETRCAVCCVRRLHALHDSCDAPRDDPLEDAPSTRSGGGPKRGRRMRNIPRLTPGSPYRPAFRQLVAGAKFSWEEGAEPMAQRADGSYDASGWFTTQSMDYRQRRGLYARWGKEIDRRRGLRGQRRLRLVLFRPHSLRHGAAKNFKRLRVDPDFAAAHLCMSKEVYLRIYGVEDATTIGEEFTPQIGGASHGVAELVREVRLRDGIDISETTVQFVLERLNVHGVQGLAKASREDVAHIAHGLGGVGVAASAIEALHAAAVALAAR